MPRKAMRDVVVCLPGIIGSVLRKDGRDIWNVSGGAVLDALRTLGDSFDALTLEQDPPDVDDLGDGMTAPAVISDVHLILTDRYLLARVAGVKQPTLQSAVRDGDRFAAFAAERQASLQNDDHVLLQLYGVLTGNAIDWSLFRGAIPMTDVALDVEDVVASGDPLVVGAFPDEEAEGLLAVAQDVSTGEERARSTLGPCEDGWQEAALEGLAEGAYRVTVFGAGTVEPVTDLVVVAGR